GAGECVEQRPSMPLADAQHAGDGTNHQARVSDRSEVDDACSRLIDSILCRGAGPTMLVTSRQRLRVEGETSWQVQPLTIPPPGSGSQPDQLLAWESVSLFCDRALKSRAELPVDPGERCSGRGNLPPA